MLPLSEILLKAEIWLFARALPLRLRGRSLQECLSIAAPSQKASSATTNRPSPQRICRLVQRATNRSILMRDRRCFHQGLVAAYFLQKYGYCIDIKFGILPVGPGLQLKDAHCWLLLEGKVLLNPPEQSIVEIHTHSWNTNR